MTKMLGYDASAIAGIAEAACKDNPLARVIGHGLENEDVFHRGAWLLVTLEAVELITPFLRARGLMVWHVASSIVGQALVVRFPDAPDDRSPANVESWLAR